MDLRRQLESSEGSWNMEKMELLERFDSERKEWECQWKVMQRKIEELYQEVKLRRESNASETTGTDTFKLSLHAPSSQINTANGRTEAEGDLFAELEQEWHKSMTKRKSCALSIDHPGTVQDEKLEDCPDQKIPKKERGALNEALEEIAKITEELSSYQEEIRKKSNHSRTKSYPVVEASKEPAFSSHRPNVNHTSIKESSIPMETSQVEEQNNRKNPRVTVRTSNAENNTSEVDRTPLEKSEVPPVPPRSTSRLMTSSFSLSPQAYNAQIQNLSISCESQKCHTEKPYNSLHENQKMPGDEATATINASSTIKKDSNSGFCHSKLTYEVGRSEGGHRDGSSTLLVNTSIGDTNETSDRVTQSHSAEHHSALNCASGFGGTTLWTDRFGDSRYVLDQAPQNGNLAAKIDEFNRAVFQTNKINTASEGCPLPLTTSGNPNCNHISLCGSSANVEDPSNVRSVSNLSVSAYGDPESCSPNRSAKLSQEQKQMNGFHSMSSYHNRLHEHDWKPSNLSGRPRSADSRSNYGVVEKLLRSYGRAAVTSLYGPKYCNDEPIRMGSSCTDGSSDPLSQCLEMLQIEQRNAVMPVDWKVKWQTEKQMLPEISVPLHYANGRGFSRPARPANRRLPSRWASRSPSAPPATRRTAHGYSRSLHSQRSIV
uniref:Uncharacterized protein KIAA0408 homolog n=1 Tax=Geotrypetes seraphini TaxID=260995 RepID=A0A6P8R3M0_GEOSA|nr:uncharacterized protein KIAA0408 homolog [Geotrypetes seraphini]XP_033794584.1 uncharacterized protein KIAA0408 homolog [Geotrypetes seraphini]